MNKQAQSTLEFTMVFVVTLLFILLTVNVFVWLNHCMVSRQVAYENTRSIAATAPAEEKFLGFTISKRDGEPGKNNFYTPPKLSIFSPGGYVEK